MASIGGVFVLLVVAVSTHADGMAMLDGSAARVVTSHLCTINLTLLPRTDLLEFTVGLHVIWKRDRESEKSLGSEMSVYYASIYTYRIIYKKQ